MNKNYTVLRLSAALISGLWLLSGACGLSRQSNDEYVAPSGMAPSIAANIKHSYDEGRAGFRKYCVTCHKPEAKSRLVFTYQQLDNYALMFKMKQLNPQHMQKLTDLDNINLGKILYYLRQKAAAAVMNTAAKP